MKIRISEKQKLILEQHIDQILPISIINDEEILIYKNSIHKLFNFIGDGIWDIDYFSDFSTQTKEYTNSVVIQFHESANENIEHDDWVKAKRIIKSRIGNGGLIGYTIHGSHNKIVLEFDTNLPLGH